MNIVTKGRRQGKTYDLIITSSVTGYPIVTATCVMAQHIEEQARNMGYKIPEPMDIRSYFDYKKNRSFNGNNILIDEVDLVLNALLENNVVAATHTQPFYTQPF